jgi:hypothetical protein
LDSILLLIELCFIATGSDLSSVRSSSRQKLGSKTMIALSDMESRPDSFSSEQV